LEQLFCHLSCPTARFNTQIIVSNEQQLDERRQGVSAGGKKLSGGQKWPCSLGPSFFVERATNNIDLIWPSNEE
jgi:hypothetical protein